MLPLSSQSSISEFQITQENTSSARSEGNTLGTNPTTKTRIKGGDEWGTIPQKFVNPLMGRNGDAGPLPRSEVNTSYLSTIREEADSEVNSSYASNIAEEANTFYITKNWIYNSHSTSHKINPLITPDKTNENIIGPDNIHLNPIEGFKDFKGISPINYIDSGSNRDNNSVTVTNFLNACNNQTLLVNARNIYKNEHLDLDIEKFYNHFYDDTTRQTINELACQIKDSFPILSNNTIFQVEQLHLTLNIDFCQIPKIIEAAIRLLVSIHSEPNIPRLKNIIYNYSLHEIDIQVILFSEVFSDRTIINSAWNLLQTVSYYALKLKPN